MYRIPDQLRSQLQLSDLEIEDLKNAFSLFDTQSKGKISYSDFETLRSTIGLRNRNSLLGHDQTDSSHSNSSFKDCEEIDFAQFLRLTMLQTRSRQNSYQVESDIREAFYSFDKEHKGFLNVSDLKQVLHSLGDNAATDDDVFEMMKEADVGKDNRLNFEEFRSMMRRTLSEHS